MTNAMTNAMTNPAPEVSTPEWIKPGPGTWQLDSSHFSPDCARIAQRAVEIGMWEGTGQAFEVLAAPLERMEAAFVNGNFYHRLVPLIAADRDLKPPPAPVLWLVAHLHPAFRRRAKQAKEATVQTMALAERARWNDEWKPQLVARSRQLTAINPADLDDEALADHVAEAVDHLNNGTIIHFRLHGSDLGPIGLLLVRARDWGLDQRKIMAAMAGASPSTTEPVRTLHQIGRLAAAGRQDDDLTGDDQAGDSRAGDIASDAEGRFASLDEVRAASDEAARQLDAYIDTYGWRLTTGYDLQDLALIELPEVLLASINAAASGRFEPSGTGDAARSGQDALAELRAAVPAEEVAEFDQMADAARALYELRDENGPITYQWPAGIVRRAVVEAGRRLVSSGRIAEPDHVFDLEADELVAALGGRSGPSAEELADRCRRRRSWVGHKAPELLGPPADPPPLWTLPSSLADLMDIVITVLALLDRDQSPAAKTEIADRSSVSGEGVGTDTVVGRARVVVDEVDALARMEPGDVLVAPFTVPTYNAVLAMAGAVVVEEGGLLCHAAVIARELGIPGLIGAANACSTIPDGALVEVDPRRGTLRVLQPPS